MKEPSASSKPCSQTSRMDLVADRAPAFDGPVESLRLDRAHGAVERNPGHHLRVDEVLPRRRASPRCPRRASCQRCSSASSSFCCEPPRARARSRGRARAPGRARPSPRRRRRAAAVRSPRCRRGPAATPRSPAATAARYSVEPPLAGDAVHDLQVVGIARRPRAAASAPRRRFARRGRPAAARAASASRRAASSSGSPSCARRRCLGQRRRRRCDDAAGRRVGQRLQDHQRAVDERRAARAEAAPCSARSSRARRRPSPSSATSGVDRRRAAARATGATSARTGAARPRRRSTSEIVRMFSPKVCAGVRR